MNNSNLLTLTPVGVVRMIESTQHFLKVQGGVGADAHMAWVPLSTLTKEIALKGFVADYFAYIAEKNDPALLSLSAAVAVVNDENCTHWHRGKPHPTPVLGMGRLGHRIPPFR